MNRPNIIFIVADDLGFADLGCYGGRDAEFGPVSPQIDRLAAQGLRFTQAYSNSPVCSPTRFAMITARYQYRLRAGIDEPLSSRPGQGMTLGLPPGHPTLPSLLQAQGYRTALVGKWHLGALPGFGPLKSGYEEFFGPMSGAVDYFSHCTNNGAHDLYLGEAAQTEEGYLTDLLSRRAVDYVHRMARQKAPFLLSLHYTAPHWPWETRDDQGVSQALNKGLFHLNGGNIHTYRRMIHHMDEGIGWLVEALRQNGQLHNTLLVFTSDNGGERFSDNWPLVGGKMDLTEGGIRVPWIAHWPEVIVPGRTSSQVCMTMDWSATMLELAGASAAPGYPLDGVSILPVLQAEGREFPRPLHWRMNHRAQRALREGDWKYLRVDGHDYLFHLPSDERERANLAAQQAGRLAAMRDHWEAWNASMPPIPDDASVILGYSQKDMPQR
ncbi:sulfatase-like hydrolase/transferase [Hydrogenophaga sp. YM1]|uniref:sulfatase family protein n=1 Tax=Hydrogenophaga sp. YM1 TaxID=2806262 RepID=UPI00195C00B4|nr:sulfatase-like hydrolase/transferase [Hydrogenophaga sp. YM1]QRR34005.1 sulfatase-like hydrolase/transferase [Hydrogenophaga sp. YM1]